MSHIASAALVQPADEEYLRHKPLQDQFCRDHSGFRRLLTPSSIRARFERGYWRAPFTTFHGSYWASGFGHRCVMDSISSCIGMNSGSTASLASSA